ncbi:hypothetical protein E1212_07595 [Jiangella ureilytica]|uniref:Uncharacterized protein n=1 Tax=Jiangella ureilytica TaxID=2530374 RepID=A0A4V2XXI3_9ACTN|nr:hypothetical protein [Jiangella ureilytica]TDC52995.1 hypothetical protein E1212_07595 [Jiangella ureilytica]
MNSHDQDHNDPVERPEPPDEDADFADEHSSTTFADEPGGGPGSAAEPESPRGQGGDGGMDLDTPADEYRPHGGR